MPIAAAILFCGYSASKTIHLTCRRSRSLVESGVFATMRVVCRMIARKLGLFLHEKKTCKNKLTRCNTASSLALTQDMATNFDLKFAIIRSGKTQTDVAEKAQLHDSRLSRIINGRQPPPNDDEKKAIAKALRLPVDHLFPSEVAQ